MKLVEFVLWLDGFVSAIGNSHPTPEQWAVIRDRLNGVSNDIKTALSSGHMEEDSKTAEQENKGAEKIDPYDGTMGQAFIWSNFPRVTGTYSEIFRIFGD